VWVYYHVLIALFFAPLDALFALQTHTNASQPVLRLRELTLSTDFVYDICHSMKYQERTSAFESDFKIRASLLNFEANKFHAKKI
jgi:hypothetical protein